MEEIVKYLIAHGITITTMESCTAGLLASSITDYEGSSAIFKGGFVTYSNEAKVMAGVPAKLIETYGVYSPEVAEAMARACRKAFDAEIGVGVTGTTGNVDPNNSEGIPGEIFYAIVRKPRDLVESRRLTIETAGMSRHEMKERIVAEIAKTLQKMIGEQR